MARDGKEQRIREIELCIESWKEYQQKYSANEVLFHCSQSMIDKLESKLDIWTRAEK